MTVHRRSQFKCSLATGLAAAALATPVAHAGPILEPGFREAPHFDRSDVAAVAPGSRAADGPVTVRDLDDGFDWASAAIGAGGAGMLMVLALGGAAHVMPGRNRVSSS